MLPTCRQRISGWLEPAGLLLPGIYYFFLVFAERCARAGPFQLSGIQDEAFSRFWVQYTSEGGPKSEEDLTWDSATLIPPLLSAASGVVLDIGPGSGTHIPFLANHINQITHIYGAEPSLGFHKTLSDSLTQSKINDKYTIMACSADPTTLVPAIRETVLGSERKSGSGAVDERKLEAFDTIVCIRVLCSVENPRQTIQGLYNVLKPGGKMIVCEHTVNPWRTRKGSAFARLLQILYSLGGWNFFIGGCHLDRDTEAFLVDAAKKDGGWGDVDLEYNFWWKPIPCLAGVLTKKKHI